jgi:uncharacterized protein YllA (UPF0747 family)
MLKIEFFASTATNLLLDELQTVEVPTVYAAWDHLHKVCDVNIKKHRKSALDKLEVKIEGLKPNDYMPERIIFIVNEFGEVVFKDAEEFKQNR